MHNEKTQLENIKLSGFKSIKQVEIDLKNINVLIGANGAGKSNFISFFKMLKYLTSSRLQEFIARNGFANALLHYGTKNTKEIRFNIRINSNKIRSIYEVGLSGSAPDSLYFDDEFVKFESNAPIWMNSYAGPSGHKETAASVTSPTPGGEGQQSIQQIVNGWRVFQFHDTSDTAEIRKAFELTNNQSLRDNGGNLAPFLYMLKMNFPQAYRKIVATIKLAAPHFGDFVLEPDVSGNDFILLRWREAGSDYEFGPHQISDGLLRFMALTTLLEMPEQLLPSLIIIDEPELGLHPYAINLLCSMIKKASQRCQIILATQSVGIVDQFTPEDIIVVNRIDGCSEYSRLSSEDLSEWLEEYSLGQLWEKNVLTARP